MMQPEAQAHCLGFLRSGGGGLWLVKGVEFTYVARPISGLARYKALVAKAHSSKIATGRSGP